MSASICLATTPGLGVYQWKRSKDVKYYVHICHMASDPTLLPVYISLARVWILFMVN